MTVGSIEGAGTFQLGSKALPVGLNSNNVNTVSGTIMDGGSAGGIGGSLIKVGSNLLALKGANTYTGGTTIMAGTLVARADNNLGGASGALTFDGGTLDFATPFELSDKRAITLA
jgi:fibronectin-binding autotransporter adhesin